jgi:hypothetical protein
MSETSKDKDQEKGDEVLRRLLNTPPKPHNVPSEVAAGPKPTTPGKQKQNKKTDSQQ